MKFLVVTHEVARKIRRDLRNVEKLPIKGDPNTSLSVSIPDITFDEFGDPIPTFGWTSEAIADPIRIDNILCLLFVPDKYLSNVVGHLTYDSVDSLPLTLKKIVNGIP